MHTRSVSLVLSFSFISAIIVGAAGAPLAPALADAPTLIASDQPDGSPTHDIVLKMTGDVTSASLPLYVSQPVTSTEVLTNVRLFAYLSDQAGQTLSGIFAGFGLIASDGGATGQPDSAVFSIPAGGRQLPISFTVSNLGSIGTFQGYLLADVDGNRTRLASLTVERYPAPSLSIVGPTALEWPTENFRRQFLIESANAATVNDLRVIVTPFTGPDSTQAVVTSTIDGKPISATVPVAGLATANLEMTGTLPLTGTYTTAITLIYNGQRQTTPLTVTRTQPVMAVPMDVLGIETSQNDLSLAMDATLWMVLNNTGSKPLTVTAPQLITFTLQGPGQTHLQAHFRKTSVSDEKGGVLSETVTLKPGQPQRIRLTIHELSSAGEYVGAVHVGAPGMQSIRLPVTLVAKESWLAAAFWISLGVIGGFALRIYSTVFRPRLLSQRRIIALRQELGSVDDGLGAPPKGEAGEQEKAVRDDFLNISRRRLDMLEEGLTYGTADNMLEANIADIDERLRLLPIWVKCHRRVAALQPPELGEPFRERLDKAASFLLERKPSVEGGAGVTKAKELGEDLQKMDKEITPATQKKLHEQLDVLQQEVQANLPANKRDAIIKTIEGLKGQVEQNPESVRKQLNQARADYTNALIDELRGSVGSAVKAPLGFEKNPQAWNDLKARINSKLDAAANSADVDAMVKQYRDAYGEYLHALSQKLGSEISDYSRTYQDRKADFDPLADRLKGIDSAMASGQLSQAAKEYEAVRDAFQKILDSLPKQQGAAALPPVASAAATSDLAEAPREEPVAVPPIDLVTPLPKTLSGVRSALLGGDLVRLIVTLIIAIVVGLKLLWLDDPTWGGWGDYIVALLWGFGLHELSASTFQGVASLPGKLWGTAKS